MKGGLSLDIMTIAWAVAFVIFIIVELATAPLVSIWLALGSLVAFLCAYFFGIPFGAQLAIFIAVSAISLVCTLPLRKKVNSEKIPTNSELDVGKNARVIEEINAELGTGRVSMNGVDWSAVSADERLVIPEGSIVVIKEINGAKLIVTPKTEKVSSIG